MIPRSQERAGLYVHIPFCSSICPYCDFAVTTGRPAEKARFVKALIREIELTESPFVFDTIYLGGGTPSALPPTDLERIVDRLRERFRVTENATLCLEANPEHVDADATRAWRDQGVSFLSLGIQSFDGLELRFLHRRHGPRIAQKSVAVALDAGFATVSVDLIFGLPDQSLGTWIANLDEAARSGASHISCYQLTIHKDTVFAHWREAGRLTEMPEDNQAELFERTYEVLEGAGFAAYEVSNFAKTAAHRSRHNLKYWRHVPYLGLGPSAHSFDGRNRSWNHRKLQGIGSLGRQFQVLFQVACRFLHLARSQH